MNMQSIMLGGGCFWCLDPIYRNLEGITDVVVGYAGGEVKNPSYREVCGGQTGHAEVINIEFNANVISLEKILEVFFSIHDPTTVNQQGADKGTQYRSIILYSNNNHMIQANQTIDALNQHRAFNNPIVTEVVPLETFYPAEEYHQNYFAKNPEQTYCQLVIAPKIQKFNRVFKKQD